MEVWDVYDENRLKTGAFICRGDSLALGQYHLAVDVWIINRKGEVLLQQRSYIKDAGAGLWCCTGGAALTGEDSAQACRREVMEELGIEPEMKQARIIYQNTWGNCHKDVWLIKQDIKTEAFRLQAEEVEAVRWVSIEQLEREMNMPLLFWKLTYMDCILNQLKEEVQMRGKENV